MRIYIYIYPQRVMSNVEPYIQLKYLCPSVYPERSCSNSLARMADKAKEIKKKKYIKKKLHNYTHWLRSIQYLEGSAVGH